MVLTQVQIFTILERLVSTTTFLKLNHFIDVWLLELLNVVELFTDFILTVLRLGY